MSDKLSGLVHPPDLSKPGYPHGWRYWGGRCGLLAFTASALAELSELSAKAPHCSQTLGLTRNNRAAMALAPELTQWHWPHAYSAIQQDNAQVRKLSIDATYWHCV